MISNDSEKIGFISNRSNQADCPNSQRNIAFVNHHLESGKMCKAYYKAEVKSCGSSPEIRYINPAIYTVDEKENNAVHLQSKNNCSFEGSNEQLIETNHGDSNSSTMNLPFKHSIAEDLTAVDHTGDQFSGRTTYRCYSIPVPDTTLSLQPSSTRSALSSETIARVERRCKIGSIMGNVCPNEAEKSEEYNPFLAKSYDRYIFLIGSKYISIILEYVDGNKKTAKKYTYILDNRQVARISMTSLSNPSITNFQKSNGSEFGRRLSYLEWIRKKHEATQRKREEEERAAKKQQEEEERMARQKEEKNRLEKENFLKWMERKKQQELDRKAMLENELELQKRLKEVEDKAAVAKALYLRQWVHKKKEEQKIQYKEQKMKQQKMNEEREKRLEQSMKAYEKWKESSKTKPKPATQGLLPHQKAKPAYINPIPWQPIIDIDSDEVEEDIFNNKRKT